jgi:hypothetical protein
MGPRAEEVRNGAVFRSMLFPLVHGNARECCIRLRVKINEQRLLATSPAVRRKIDSDCSFSNTALEI